MDASCKLGDNQTSCTALSKSSVRFRPKTCDYKVHVKTAESHGAGTDSTVVMHLEDLNGEVRFSKNLDRLIHKNLYERGNTDRFYFEEACSQLHDTKLRVEHKGGGMYLVGAYFISLSII